MGFDYLNFCSYWKNLTSPRTCWHKGTALQFDMMRNYPQTQVVLTDLGTDMVLVTMAARIMQSVMSLGKNILQKRALYWRMLPLACMNKAVRAAVWVCWSVLDLLLPFLMTTVYVYKNRSRCKTMCNSEQPMNTVTIKCHWGGQADPVEKMIDEEELCNLMMAKDKVAIMEDDYECEQMSKMDSMLNKEIVLQSCTNPVILSMICMPSEHMDSSESDVESVDEGLVEKCSLEDVSVDSGMQESWTPMSKFEDCDEESDWSDDDSWDEESNPCNENEDLWASFCRSDDPYNLLSFAMPTKSPEQPNKGTGIENVETQDNLDSTKVEYVTATEKNRMLCKKPVLSGYKSSHKCMLPKEEAKEGDQCTKKVRFSPKVTVHPIITWSFAHRMARKGPWEEYARDRCRFQKRIAETEAAIGFCLEPPHRQKIRERLQSKQN